MNYAVCLLLLAIIPCIVWISGRAYGNVFSPISIFMCVWLFAIALFLLDLIEYVPVDASTWLILLGAILAFCFGSALVTMLWPRLPGEAQSERQVRKVNQARLRVVYLFSCGFGFIGFFAYVMLVGRSVGLDALLFQPYLFRAAQTNIDFSKTLQWERTLNYLNVFNFVLGLYMRATYGMKSRLLLACTLGALATTFFSFERTTPFMAIIWGFFATHLGRHKLKTLKMGIFLKGASLTVVLVAVFVAVGAWLGKTFENNPELQRSWSADEMFSDLALPYVYLTGNIAGFQEYMRSYQPGETLGQFVVLPVVKIAVMMLGMKHQPPQEVRDFMLIPFPFNTSTFLNVYWSDFGLFGVIMMPFVLGVVSTIAYVLADRTGMMRWVLFASLFLYALLHSIFVNKLITTPFWLFSSVLFPVGWFVQDKGFAPSEARLPREIV